jgi:hypothetical protein
MTAGLVLVELRCSSHTTSATNPARRSSPTTARTNMTTINATADSTLTGEAQRTRTLRRPMENPPAQAAVRCVLMVVMPVIRPTLPMCVRTPCDMSVLKLRHPLDRRDSLSGSEDPLRRRPLPPEWDGEYNWQCGQRWNVDCISGGGHQEHRVATCEPGPWRIDDRDAAVRPSGNGRTGGSVSVR